MYFSGTIRSQIYYLYRSYLVIFVAHYHNYSFKKMFHFTEPFRKNLVLDIKIYNLIFTSLF
uniref:Uncharacterized protein n=1 Tax=Kalanchoe fedtschenkoi TaxID=63787 RepID=A0A7N0UMC2_KALFE